MSDAPFIGVLVSLLAAAGAITLMQIEVDRLDGRVGRLERALVCSYGASSVGPVTIRNGHLAGKTTASVTGCRP